MGRSRVDRSGQNPTDVCPAAVIYGYTIKFASTIDEFMDLWMIEGMFL
jgi:hypothetical protein